MDEQQLRALVRDAIARHLGPLPDAPAAAPPAAPAAVAFVPMESIATARFAVPRLPGESHCVIEPAVTCNHCGHCLCYGH